VKQLNPSEDEVPRSQMVRVVADARARPAIESVNVAGRARGVRSDKDPRRCP